MLIDLQNQERKNLRLDRQIEEEQAAFAGEPYRMPEMTRMKDLVDDFFEDSQNFINKQKNE